MLKNKKSDNIKEIVNYLNSYDRILIGAGAGLSASVGLDYTDNKKFAEIFPKMVEKGFEMQYELLNYEGENDAERWAYWATHINYVRYQFPVSDTYKKLLEMLKEKDYYVVTSNADGMFLRSGFNPKRVFEIQGDYDRLKCSNECTLKSWDTKPIIDKVIENINPENFKVENINAIPKCPNCGAPMSVAFRFREDYEANNESYLNWLKESLNKKLLIIEIGVGFNTPGVIRLPFERIVQMHNNVKFVRINAPYKDYQGVSYPGVPDVIRKKSISINEDAKNVIEAIYEENMKADQEKELGSKD